MVEWVQPPILYHLCGRDACQVNRTDVLFLWPCEKLMGLPMALVAVKTDRLLQAEACTESSHQDRSVSGF